MYDRAVLTISALWNKGGPGAERPPPSSRQKASGAYRMEPTDEMTPSQCSVPYPPFSSK